MENDYEFLDDEKTIELVLDDGTKMTCDVIGIFEVDEEEYIALAEPNNDNILIYIFEENGKEINLKNIESKEKYVEVSEVFMELFADLFYDEEE